MSLSDINPLVMPRNFMQSSMQSPMQQSTSVSPQEWEYIQTMRRTGWDMNQQFPQQNQIPQSDPYNDTACINVLEKYKDRDEYFDTEMIFGSDQPWFDFLLWVKNRI